jgi:acyl carrier protein
MPDSKATIAQPQTEDAIRDWLVAYIAKKTSTPADDIETDVTFDRYGLDSAVAIALTGDLEDYLGRRLSPTLPYNYTSIDAMAAHLAQGGS